MMVSIVRHLVSDGMPAAPDRCEHVHFAALNKMETIANYVNEARRLVMEHAFDRSANLLLTRFAVSCACRLNREHGSLKSRTRCKGTTKT